MSHPVDECYDSYVETCQRARKAHECCACSDTIPVGTEYTRVFVLFDGLKSTYKRCARCQQIHVHLRDMGSRPYYDSWPDEQLACGQDYEDEWGKPPPDEIAALAFALPGELLPEKT